MNLLPFLPEVEDLACAWDDASDRWLTRAELRTAVKRFANQLTSAKKSLVFLLPNNDIRSLISFLGAIEAGHSVALIDPTLSEDRFGRLAAAYEPEFVVCPPERTVELRDADAGRVCMESGLGLLDVVRGNRSSSTPIAEDLAILLSTSGTTGAVKFVRLTMKAVLANARQIIEALDINRDDVGIAHLPLHYSYGLSVATSHLAAGARVGLTSSGVTSPDFNSRLGRMGGTHFPGVPFHYSVLNRLGVDRLIPDCVKTFTQAGGALDMRVGARIHQSVAARGGRYYVMYGQTEASPRIATLPHGEFDRKPGSVGRPMPGGHVTIVDQAGNDLPADTPGRVIYFGPNVMLGYARSRADLAKGDELSGRLDTGDIGRLDAEGFLYLTGRTQRFAKVAGLRLGLDEIEAELASICSTACLAMGEKVAVLHEDVAFASALKARLKELSVEYKIPSASFDVKTIASIPRKGSGKIDYDVLKETIGV